MEILFIRKAKYVSDYRIELEFSHGVSGCLDFSSFLTKKPFRILSDMDVFRNFSLNEWTIFWDELDIAPETLYDEFIKQNMYISAFPNE